LRIITHDTHTGPGLLRLRLPAGSVTLTASPDTTQASITLAPERADDQAALDAIERTEVSQSGDLLAVTVPATGTAGGFTQTIIQSGGRVFVSQNARVVTGTVTGVTITGNGSIVIGGGNTVIAASGGGIRADVRVPAGQRIEIDADSAGLTTTGPLATVHADTGSGDLRIEQADDADLTTGSGDITLGRVGSVKARTGSGDVCAAHLHTGTVRTGSGDITIRAITGPMTLRTGSGDVRAHLAAEVPLKAKTGSGDIRVTAEPGIRIDRSGLRTGSGDIRTR
jgi:hypothetical protein